MWFPAHLISFANYLLCITIFIRVSVERQRCANEQLFLPHAPNKSLRRRHWHLSMSMIILGVHCPFNLLWNIFRSGGLPARSLSDVTQRRKTSKIYFTAATKCAAEVMANMVSFYFSFLLLIFTCSSSYIFFIFVLMFLNLSVIFLCLDIPYLHEY